MKTKTRVILSVLVIVSVILFIREFAKDDEAYRKQYIEFIRSKPPETLTWTEYQDLKRESH